MRRLALPTLAVAMVLSLPPRHAHAGSPPTAVTRTPVFAGTVRGRVTERANGTPIAGAQVTIGGTILRAVTDDQGRYTITRVPAGQQTISVRGLGFSPQSMTVSVTDNGEATADFTLTRMAAELGQVVITATGQQAKVELGHTVATVRADSLVAEAPITNVTDMLQGRVAGLMTFSNSGVTGSAPRIRIRGFNSLSQPNQPLMIVDGVRIENTTGGGSAGGNTVQTYGWSSGAVTSINPDEIETFEIVKGPSAATLYGTDAANGVIVITTKRGIAGRTRMTMHVESGIVDAPDRWNTNYYAFGKTPTGQPINCVNFARVSGQCVLDSLSAYNVMKQSAASPLGTGHRESAGLQFSGGVQQFRYFFSGDAEREIGYLKLSDSEIRRLKAQRGGAEIPDEQIRPNYLKRGSLRGNVSADVGSKTEFSLTNGITFQKSQIPSSNMFSDAAWGSGWRDQFDGWGQGGYRPGERFAVRSAENLFRATTSVNMNSSPTSWLSVRATAGVDINSNFSDNLQRRDQGGIPTAPSLGRRLESRVLTALYTGDVGASATRSITPTLNTRTSVGLQYNRRNRGLTTAEGTNLPTGSETLAGAATVTNRELTDQKVVAGGYVEEQIGWRDYLFVTGGLRADGASSFGKNFKTAYYPKVSLSWLASNAGFFPENRLLSSLRFRLAWGASGVTPSSTAALAQNSLSTVFLNGATVSAAKLQALGNPNLKPERTEEIETGIDAELFGGRAHLEATVYQKQSSDALVQRAYPRSVGILGTGQLDNVGAVRNQGIEVAANGVVFDFRGVSFDLRASGSVNRNKLTKLDPTLRPPEDRFVKFVEGYPLFGQWDRKIKSYRDANGDGILQVSEVQVGDSIEFLGNTNPTRMLNVSPSLSFLRGQLRVSSMFVYKGGFIQTNFTELNKCNIGGCRARNDPNAPIDEQVAYAALAGPTLTYAGMAQNGTFTRWAEAAVVYELNEALRNRIGGRSATLMLSARNLKLWTKYRGIDPEVAQNPELSGNFGTLWDLGYDNPVSPPSRYYILRLTLGY